MTLQINNVNAWYGRHQVLHDVEVGSLEPGTMVGVIGPNAAGKSTLVKALMGLVKTSGEMKWIHEDGRIFEGKALRDICGYVPQDLPGGVALSAFESIAISAQRYAGLGIPKGTSLQRASAACEELGITSIAERNLANLSGGQRQLVSIAQVVASHPQILLLDEPTSALDIHRQVQVLNLMHTISRQDNALVMVVLHDLNLAARLCDKIMVVAGGEITYSGSPDEVITPDVIRATYELNVEVLNHRGLPLVCPVSAVGTIGAGE
ncbi:MAG: ABC transporter ATP-binding protein [Actinomycetaceae bacterium]|nr:ABC transporter ATP-binding protein [Actinomycetaceae bacterium]